MKPSDHELLDSDRYSTALKVFNNICIEWHLTGAEQCSLVVSEAPDQDSVITMSRVFCIYAALRSLFEDIDQAANWIHKDNDDLGQPAIELMKSTKGLVRVQKYLSQQLELMTFPVTREKKDSIEHLVNGVEVNLEKPLMKEPGDKGLSGCDKCGQIVDITYQTRDMPFSDGSSIVPGIRVGVCDQCDSIVSMPKQLSEAVAKAIEKQK